MTMEPTATQETTSGLGNEDNQGQSETTASEYKNISDLPQDVRDALPEDAQHIFMAAFNSFMANSNSREAAARVAWATIERDENYTRGEDGKWKRSTQTDDGTHGALSTMSGS